MPAVCCLRVSATAGCVFCNRDIARAVPRAVRERFVIAAAVTANLERVPRGSDGLGEAIADGLR